jgi:hypothetical protein
LNYLALRDLSVIIVITIEKEVVMKTRLFVLPLAFFTLFIFSATSTSWGTLITFDELPENGTGSFIALGYQGLAWSNFVAQNTVIYTANNNTNGYYYGLVSASNEAFNAFGNPAGIAATGTNFNFLSVYLTGAWRSNLDIQVQGFRGGNLAYDNTVMVSATNPTLFAFNYLNIDRLAFNSFGGGLRRFWIEREQLCNGQSNFRVCS